MSNRWHHSPAHFLDGKGAYIVTAGTYRKDLLFNTPEKLTALTGGLLKYAGKFGWDLKAWAVFPNHYHFVGFSPEAGSATLEPFMQKFHSRSAIWLNRIDKSKGRQVWHNYWETHLTFEKSYYARLNYVHQNPVRHGQAKLAKDYQWGSARHFEHESSRAEINKIYSFPIDQLKIIDDFVV